VAHSDTCAASASDRARAPVLKTWPSWLLSAARRLLKAVEHLQLNYLLRTKALLSGLEV